MVVGTRRSLERYGNVVCYLDGGAGWCIRMQLCALEIPEAIVSVLSAVTYTPNLCGRL